MNQQVNPRTESARPGRPRWQVAIFQLLFGTMAVALGGFISAEPTLSLDRREDGCRGSGRRAARRAVAAGAERVRGSASAEGGWRHPAGADRLRGR